MINGKQRLSLIDREAPSSILFLRILHTGVKWVLILSLIADSATKRTNYIHEQFSIAHYPRSYLRCGTLGAHCGERPPGINSKVLQKNLSGRGGGSAEEKCLNFVSYF